MINETLVMALAKVLIAAAWADGALDHEEVNCMKDLLYQLPELSARRWASLQIYLDAPVDEAERTRLLEELRAAIRTPADRALALRMWDELLEADGQMTAEEEAVAAEIKAGIETVDVGPLAHLVKGLVGRRARTVAGAPNREEHLQDYLKNKVYYGIRRRLEMGEAALDLEQETLRTLSLAGGVMAQVARVNPEITDGEVAVMVDALQTHWHLTPEQAAFVAGVAISETATLLDPYRLAREFAAACTRRQRAEFLDVLFAVAVADGEASFQEIEEIRALARALKLSHRQFIQAKLKIPSERRRQ